MNSAKLSMENTAMARFRDYNTIRDLAENWSLVLIFFKTETEIG